MVKCGYRSFRTSRWSDILVAEQGVVSLVPAGLIRKFVLLPGVGGGAQGIARGAVDTDSDEIGERPTGVARHFLRLRRAQTEDGGNVGGSVFQDVIRLR